MKRTLLLAVAYCLAALVCRAAIGEWHTYLSYYDIMQIVKAGSEDIFVLASNDLYSYNLEDEAITTYDRTNSLSDSEIDVIGWNSTVGKLLIAYSNSNIDLMDIDGNVTNLPELYNKSFTEDKTINSIYMYGKYAYLATGFGVMKVDMDKCEISESYIIYSYNMSQVVISGSTIYAKRSNGQVYSATLTDNLIDRNNWTLTTSYDSSIFTTDTSDYDEYYDLVSSLSPGGPKTNLHGFLRLRGSKLYTVPTGYTASLDNAYAGHVQVLNNVSSYTNYWTIYEDDFGTSDHLFVDVMSVDVDPNDESRVFACGRTGLYEFRDGSLYIIYDTNNCPFVRYHDRDNFFCTFSLYFDDDGNLWVVDSQSSTSSLFCLDTNGEWHSHHCSEFTYGESGKYTVLEALYEDSRGLLWFLHNHWSNPAVFSYDKDSGEAHVYNNFLNQDATALEINSLSYLCEDTDGNMWIGTSAGPIYISEQFITSYTDNYYFTQFKVPRNDGTNYADYLLSGISITDLAIDAAGRKWFATQNTGVYLISEDNLEVVEHFTYDNSYLLSDIVYNLAIDDNTGEVFFATSKGLCSYVSDATTTYEEMTTDNVYAYPNPVEPGYDGLITIVGLSFNADVKIVSPNGALIAEGRSSGGTFTWDGTNSEGKRVASGVYMVMTAKSDGSSGTVCKIAIVN